MTTHTVDLEPNYLGLDHWHSTHEYRMPSRYAGHDIRAKILYVGPNGEARRVFGGPTLPGPFASVVPLASVIAAYDVGTPPTVHDVRMGDVLSLDGVEFVITDHKRGAYPQLSVLIATL